MDFLNILKEIEKVDADVYDRLNPRRAAMKAFFNVGKKVAVAAVPFAIGSMFKKAYAQTNATPAIISVLNYSLAIEHFSAAFYEQGFNATTFTGNTAAIDKAAIGIIRDQEFAHVRFLEDTIRTAGGTPVTKQTTYDYTGKGEFSNPFSVNSFLLIAQGLEDTALRATKGVAGELVGQSVYLTAALNMHAVEARHSAKIRLIRMSRGLSSTLQPWISLNDQTEGRLGAANYEGEQALSQAGVLVTQVSGVDEARATEAFDEPLDRAKVKTLLAQFGVNI
jgi:hypothetical protein